MSCDNQAKRVFFPHLKKAKIAIKNQPQLILACLLALLVGWSCFCLEGLVDLTINLAISGAVLIIGKVAINLSR